MLNNLKEKTNYLSYIQSLGTMLLEISRLNYFFDFNFSAIYVDKDKVFLNALNFYEVKKNEGWETFLKVYIQTYIFFEKLIDESNLLNKEEFLNKLSNLFVFKELANNVSNQKEKLNEELKNKCKHIFTFSHIQYLMEEINKIFS